MTEQSSPYRNKNVTISNTTNEAAATGTYTPTLPAPRISAHLRSTHPPVLCVLQFNNTFAAMAAAPKPGALGAILIGCQVLRCNRFVGFDSKLCWDCLRVLCVIKALKRRRHKRVYTFLQNKIRRWQQMSKIRIFVCSKSKN
jgi:hypothetical protein